ncbi:alpha/beta fold hydrolase [uncultured Paracoccus sp.]|uniref:alpha/beta hydrolase n=1 Tax=uncultured Paracoccus sp. TaxID=189685 RepID=UPI002610E042|nr:alpha/beta fold hydrolase [uncultured Paracoccus sp.]
MKQTLGRNLIRRSVLGAALMLLAPAAASAEEPVEQVTAEIDGQDMRIYRYHPEGCAAPSILLVFHGNSRAAKSYLNSAREIADRGCFIVYSPLFDRDRFPNWTYHRGGLVRDGQLQPEEDWTASMVDDLMDWARQQEGLPEADGYLFGHSAGAQFLSRVAAYALPDDVARIILANPSSYVMPSEEEQVPYGYGGLPEPEAEGWMRDYLAAPITIYLGEEDTGSKDLTTNPPALRQGRNRLDRGERTFEAARKAAESKGWPFNWSLVRADDVGHSARGMLGAEEMVEALGF